MNNGSGKKIFLLVVAIIISYSLGLTENLILNQISLLNPKDWTILILSSIAGGIIAFGLVILVDWLKEPNLVLSKGSESPDITHNPPQYKIFHIKIKNLPRKFKFSPLKTESAFSIRGRVTLKHNSNKQTYFGKWSTTPQPLSIVSISSKIITVVDPNKALLPPREDIYPSNDENEEVQLAVAIKFDDENEFYGFSNESYLDPKLKNSNLKFSERRYKGTLLLSGNGVELKQNFKIFNPNSSMEDFHLEMDGNIY